MSLTVWRLVRAHRARDAFTGEGARRYGGRWNHRGTALVYTAQSVALAALETFVHLGHAAYALPYVFFAVRMPSSVTVERLEISDLPANWRVQPPPDDTKAVGSQWVTRGQAAVLRVPSVLVPSEHNYLLNPQHRDFPKLTIDQPEPFTFDPRMWK